jgi:transglutaminase-like putative cysteine protease
MQAFGFRRCAGYAVLLMVGLATASAHADVFKWTQPTQADLNMTSVPGYPGAPALYLNREEVTNDDLHSVLHYERIKVLTEKGKDYANVELRFVGGVGDFGDDGVDNKMISDVAGRTIHADGTVIPFTGKTYLKTIFKTKSVSYQARVFTLPDVEVGSILEYRYATRIDDNIFEAPSWYAQSDLFTRALHYRWIATSRELSSDSGSIASIIWFPILPASAKFTKTSIPEPTFDLTMTDVPPAPDEEFMPPIRSFTYRVMFSYSPYQSQEQFWKEKGKQWSKAVNSFADSDKDSLRSAAADAVAGQASEEAKARKLYALVQGLENTDNTRTHNSAEEKLAGEHRDKAASDVLANKRGDATQLAELYIALARSVGLKAYAVLVPSRAVTLFVPAYTSFDQFDHMLVLVSLDGHDVYLDPGTRDCPYGELGWEYTVAQGIRQSEGGTAFTTTPAAYEAQNSTQRVGDLHLALDGTVQGKLTLTFTGARALAWREIELKNDSQELRKQLRTAIEDMVPGTLHVDIASVDGEDAYEKPLVVHATVEGTLGTVMAKRILLPADIFVAKDHQPFTQARRDVAVDLHYAQRTLDAVRVTYPASMSVEAAPAELKLPLLKDAFYSMTTLTGPNSITVRRNDVLGTFIYTVADYPGLRSFYDTFEAKDKDSIVLKLNADAAPAK